MLQALDEVIKESIKNKEGLSISALARNGSRITQTIIDMGGYQSISGNYIRIDSNGDSEGNFTAFALKAHNISKESERYGKTFSCSSYMMPVGEFQTALNHGNHSKENQTAKQPKDLPTYVSVNKIDWPGKFRPLAEPECGYYGEKCQVGKKVTKISVSVLGGFLVIALIITLWMYRMWKIEEEIEGLVWKIQLEDLEDNQGIYLSRPSLRGSLISGMRPCIGK